MAAWGIAARAAWTDGGAPFLLPLSFVYAFICLSAWYVCRVLPLEPGADVRARSLPCTSSAAAITSGVWVTLGQGWAAALDSLFAGLDAGALLARTALAAVCRRRAAVLARRRSCYYLLIAFQASRDAETRALELSLLAREAELKALRAQIDPHFLFNSLNSISALTSADPAAARRMCVLLADFLRDTLRLGANAAFTLGEEFDLAERFLAIERVRLGPRLSVTREADPGSRRASCRRCCCSRSSRTPSSTASRISSRAGRSGWPPPAASARSPSRSRTPAIPEAAARGNGHRPGAAPQAPWPHSSATKAPFAWTSSRTLPRRSPHSRGDRRMTIDRRSIAPSDQRRRRRRRSAGAGAPARVPVARIADIEIVAECANGFEAVKAVTELEPDLLLLDVQMPKLDGFEVLELVGDDVTVIFVTAYDSYAIRAFDVHAVDYLLKPFSAERLDEALDRARARIARRASGCRCSALCRRRPAARSRSSGS